MLQLQHIRKQYVTGDLTQNALNDVSLNLRESEFVAILGPSGSGKTTLLNVIGGLDRYDSGDLLINGVSTRNYNDRDWDAYRNHTIGFVFQSYNLIPHQSVLANVELALTISGVSRSERRERARHALEEVGLGDQLHKKPNQLSGGQMQRVAIARALVNDPDILLADEPTGALDSETSVQVMRLLQEVASRRLVVMVTHNAELAEEYATRIVRLRDGSITDDSDPYMPEETQKAQPGQRMGKASMSFLTALSLSFSNLRTKKARTLLTAFAGSIGIIGIALILSLSTGVNNYINDLQKRTMTSYPITIQAQTMDLSAMAASGRESRDEVLEGIDHPRDGVYSNPGAFAMASSMSMSVTNNNLTAFKAYLDDPASDIRQFIGENGVICSYDTGFSVYAFDPDGVMVNTDGSSLSGNSALYSGMNMASLIGFSTQTYNNFQELMPGKGDALISDVVTQSYDLLYGRWPESYDEVVLRVNRRNELSSLLLYELGILPISEYNELLAQLRTGEGLKVEKVSWTYADICEKTFSLIPDCDTYVENEKGLFDSVADDPIAMRQLAENGLRLKLVGVIRAAEDADYTNIISPLAYTHALTEYLVAYTNRSPVVAAQMASPDRSVLTGIAFAPSDDSAKVAEVREYLASMTPQEKAAMSREFVSAMGNMGAAGALIGNMSDDRLADMMDQYLRTADDSRLLMYYNSYLASGSYEENLAAFGYISLDTPVSISIYADTFEAKDAIADCIERYNQTVPEEDQITWTDVVALITSSVTTIIDVVSYVLIAFVAVSLVVSSIMIGIITYISVLERTKEIGILRAIGASKRNISQVFNAETFIVGLCAGIIGVAVTLLLLIPGNALIHALTDNTGVNAVLPPFSALVLVVLSVILTLIGGLIPSRKAARKDPVTALRTE